MLVVPGMGSIRGERCSCHASATCCTVPPVRAAIGPSTARMRAESSPPGTAAGCQGEKKDPCVDGCATQWRTEADADVVVRCNSRDLGDSPGGAELLDADVGESDVPDQPVCAHFRERADLLLER